LRNLESCKRPRRVLTMYVLSLSFSQSMAKRWPSFSNRGWRRHVTGQRKATTRASG